MDTGLLLRQLAISLLLGLLVGLQRERTQQGPAGFRTFPLITIFGTMTAVLADLYQSPWILAAGFAGVITVTVIGNMPRMRQAHPGSGVTTEIAMLVMFAVGAFVVAGPWLVAVVVAGGVAMLLQYKPQLHGLAARMGDKDFHAILQFVIVTFIILPVLGEYNRNYDPLTVIRPLFPNVEIPALAVLNPYEIWLMVVLVVSISLGGYLMYKLLGPRAGTLVGGVLGGTISSTATTVSFARRTLQSRQAAQLSAVVIMVASTMVYLRVLLEVGVAAPSFLPRVAGPLLVLFGVSVILSAAAWMMERNGESEMPEQENPTELKSALLFALMYALVISLVAVGKEYLPQEALYAIAGLSGMPNMDALTLSTARLVSAERLDPDVGWRLLVVGAMANLFFKALLVAALGDRGLLKRVGLLFGIALASGAGLLVFWP